MKYVPHNYQSYATDFILSHPVAAILLQMGLGKSVITLTAIKHLIETGEVKKVLVIAPLRVARDTWPDELLKWDHLHNLTYAVAVGSAEDRLSALRQDVMIHIINRENVQGLVEDSGIPFSWDMIVIDELSSFKNWQAKRFRSLLKVRPLAKRIVGLTGTPAPNGYMDLFAEYRLLDQGKRLGCFITRYRQTYFEPDRWGPGQVYSWRLKRGGKEAIQRKISDITVSMKSVDYLKMPECVMNTVHVFMDDKEAGLYDELRENLFLKVAKKRSESKDQSSVTTEPKGFQGAIGKPPEAVVDAKNAAVLCGKVREPPYIPQTDSASGSRQYESQRAGK